MKTALTVAGSDSSGGAGIQADIKAMTANGVYAMSAVTALTAQNTCGVSDILEVPPAFLTAQLNRIFTDIVPDAVKIGMVSSGGLIEAIADTLSRFRAKHIVLDPVMVATSGARLISAEAVSVLTARLLPLAELITPNIPEAEVLTGRTVRSAADMEQAAAALHAAYGCAVLLKGGHSVSDADDCLCDDTGIRWFRGRRIDNPNTHGTGCTLSAAIAANLAKGFSPAEAVGRAKRYLSGALGAMLALGHGSGPINHMFDLQSEFIKEKEDQSQ